MNCSKESSSSVQSKNGDHDFQKKSDNVLLHMHKSSDSKEELSPYYHEPFNNFKKESTYKREVPDSSTPPLYDSDIQKRYTVMSYMQEDNIDISTLLLNFNNRFTKETLTFESGTTDIKKSGFSKFLHSNIMHSLHCWEKKINSLVKNENSELGTVLKIPENSPSTNRKESVKIETIDNGCEDKFASDRCKKFLKGKSCIGNCNKIHRYPKHDGVKCYSEKFNKCYLGQNCNYLHENPDTDSDDESISKLDMKVSTPNSLVRTCQQVVKTEIQPPIQNLNIARTSKNLENVKKEPAENINCTNSISSHNNKTTIMTSTTISDGKISNLKRGLFSNEDELSHKRMRIERNNISIKKEPLDSICEYEAPIEGTVVADSLPSIKQESPLCNVSELICIPTHYELPNVTRLNVVTDFALKIIYDINETGGNLRLNSNDPYDKLCEYLQTQNISLFSELVNSKLIVWDVHIRLYFSKLLGDDIGIYRQNINTKLKEESFEQFLIRFKNEILSANESL